MDLRYAEGATYCTLACFPSKTIRALGSHPWPNPAKNPTREIVPCLARRKLMSSGMDDGPVLLITKSTPFPLVMRSISSFWLKVVL